MDATMPDEGLGRAVEMDDLKSHKDENDLGRLGKVQVLKVLPGYKLSIDCTKQNH